MCMRSTRMGSRMRGGSTKTTWTSTATSSTLPSPCRSTPTTPKSTTCCCPNNGRPARKPRQHCKPRPRSGVSAACSGPSPVGNTSFPKASGSEAWPPPGVTAHSGRCCEPIWVRPARSPGSTCTRAWGRTAMVNASLPAPTTAKHFNAPASGGGRTSPRLTQARPKACHCPGPSRWRFTKSAQRLNTPAFAWSLAPCRWRR